MGDLSAKELFDRMSTSSTGHPDDSVMTRAEFEVIHRHVVQEHKEEVARTKEAVRLEHEAAAEEKRQGQRKRAFCRLSAALGVLVVAMIWAQAALSYYMLQLFVADGTLKTADGTLVTVGEQSMEVSLLAATALSAHQLAHVKTLTARYAVMGASRDVKRASVLCKWPSDMPRPPDGRLPPRLRGLRRPDVRSLNS